MEELLLQAINANPADDLAWQALADWLEEQGDRRAELLRLSLRVRQRPASADLAGWEERLQALLTSGVSPCVPTFQNSISMKFALIPHGKFLQGSPEDEEGRYRDERLQGELEISQPFYLGVFAVTQGAVSTGNGQQSKLVLGNGRRQCEGCGAGHAPLPC